MVHSSPSALDLYAPWATSYASDGQQLTGFLFLPAGGPPFPGIVFNHGSGGLLAESKPGFDALVSMGYAVFAAVRRGHNGNPGAYWRDRISAPWGSPEMGPQLVQALEDETRDVRAAIDWLQAHPHIDPHRVAVVGSSYGGVVMLLAAGESPRFRAGVSFAGPSMTWPHAPALQDALVTAIRRTPVPLFLAQAQNDHSLAATYTLGSELARQNKPHETRIYPAIGTVPMNGHGIFGNSVPLWYADVQRFLRQWLV
jgi:dienelactone hydrolase